MMVTADEPSFANEGSDRPTVEAVRRPTLRDVPWRLTDVAIAIAPLLVLRIIHGVSDPAWFAGSPRWAFFVLSLAGFGWMLAYPLWAARRVSARLLLPGLRTWVIESALAVPTLLAIWAAVACLYWVWTLAVGQPPEPENVIDRLSRSRDTVLIAFVVLVAVTIGPVAEEVLFRGMVYNALRQRLPWLAAAVLQALAFGFAHTSGTTHAVIASFLGLTFAAVYEWRRTLLTPILLHALQNFATAAVALSALSQADQTPMLGVHGTPHTGGCIVTEVLPGGAADEAGLRIGDLITAVDETAVGDIRDVATVVRSKQVGESVRVNYVRDGESRIAVAVLKSRGR
jgi:membrane protease YdiL (CAAX protease family)